MQTSQRHRRARRPDLSVLFPASNFGGRCRIFCQGSQHRRVLVVWELGVQVRRTVPWLGGISHECYPQQPAQVHTGRLSCMPTVDCIKEFTELKNIRNSPNWRRASANGEWCIGSSHRKLLNRNTQVVFRGEFYYSRISRFEESRGLGRMFCFVFS